MKKKKNMEMEMVEQPLGTIVFLIMYILLLYIHVMIAAYLLNGSFLQDRLHSSVDGPWEEMDQSILLPIDRVSSFHHIVLVRSSSSG
jgi:sterol desaturase/sphingolipid hydroxylase (fatty acid hydroxylase superfamily)